MVLFKFFNLIISLAAFATAGLGRRSLVMLFEILLTKYLRYIWLRAVDSKRFQDLGSNFIWLCCASLDRKTKQTIA